MDEVKFQQEEVKFLKKRINQTKTQLDTYKTLNKMLLLQMAETDKVCCEYYGIEASGNEPSSVKSSTKGKITSKNYETAMGSILSPPKGSPLPSEATLMSIIEYQQERISKLSGTLETTVPSSSLRSFKENQKQANVLEKSMLNAQESREELTESLLKAMNEETETKNKLVYYMGAEAESVLGPSQLLCPVLSPKSDKLVVKKSKKRDKEPKELKEPKKSDHIDMVSTDSNTNGLTKSSSIMRKSTARLKPMVENILMFD